MTKYARCKICLSEISFIFELNILDKYPVNYFQCASCKFIQTEEPYWLKESYSSAITNLDIGLVSRNKTNAEIIENLLMNPVRKYRRYL